MKEKDPIIQFQNLKAGYQSKVAIENISFDIYKGEIIGIVGPNGSGKTTLLKSILGRVDIFDGTVTVFGRSLLKKDRHRIGYVSQKENLNSKFPAYVRHIVLMGRYAKIGLMKPITKKDKEIAYEAIKKVDLEEFVDAPYSHLSGGQQQRVLIARALAQEPEILLLDEPTSAVDITSTKTIMDLIVNLNQIYTLTIVLVAHDINMVSKYTQKMLCLNKNMCGFGIPSEVLTKEVLEKVYHIDVDIFEEKEKRYAAIHDTH